MANFPFEGGGQDNTGLCASLLCLALLGVYIGLAVVWNNTRLENAEYENTNLYVTHAERITSCGYQHAKLDCDRLYDAIVDVVYVNGNNTYSPTAVRVPIGQYWFEVDAYLLEHYPVNTTNSLIRCLPAHPPDYALTCNMDLGTDSAGYVGMIVLTILFAFFFGWLLFDCVRGNMHSGCCCCCGRDDRDRKCEHNGCCILFLNDDWCVPQRECPIPCCLLSECFCLGGAHHCTSCRPCSYSACLYKDCCAKCCVPRSLRECYCLCGFTCCQSCGAYTYSACHEKCCARRVNPDIALRTIVLPTPVLPLHPIIVLPAQALAVIPTTPVLFSTTSSIDSLDCKH